MSAFELKIHKFKWVDIEVKKNQYRFEYNVQLQIQFCGYRAKYLILRTVFILLDLKT